MSNLAGAMSRQPLLDRIPNAGSLVIVCVGSSIVVLQAEGLDSYVDALRSVDYRGKPIIACVAGKEFALADVIKMVKASIPVISTWSRMAQSRLQENEDHSS